MCNLIYIPGSGESLSSGREADERLKNVFIGVVEIFHWTN